MNNKIITPDKKETDLEIKLQKKVTLLEKKVLSLENDILKSNNKYLKLEQRYLTLQAKSNESKPSDFMPVDLSEYQ